MSDEQRVSKRPKLDADVFESNDGKRLSSLYRPISPPPRRVPKGPEMMDSPFQLTNIHDLPPAMNVDTLSLKDILGDPLIAECWEFNYLHNIDFLMEALDEDVRDLVKVHVVHGFWKQEDESRKDIEVSVPDARSDYEHVDHSVLLQTNSDFRYKLRSTKMFPYTQHTCQKCLALTIQKCSFCLDMIPRRRSSFIRLT